MASTINAVSGGAGGLISSGDTSGALQIQTGGVTAITIDSSQNVTVGALTANTIIGTSTFSNPVALNGGVTGDFKMNSGYGSIATVYGCRAWVNFNGMTSGTFAGGVSTVTRIAASTTATVTTTTAHGLITGNVVQALTGVAADTYTVTVLTTTTFTITTVATTALSAVSITFAVNSIRASGNVGSVADNGTGIYTVNFTTPLPDANYCVNASASTASISSKIRVMEGYSTAAVTIRTSGGDTSGQSDAESVFISVFR